MQDAQMPDWVAEIRQRGWHTTLLTLLDMVEPVAPIIAQGLWVGQPLADRWGAPWHRHAWQDIADALESPTACATLRQHLDQPADDSPHGADDATP